MPEFDVNVYFDRVSKKLDNMSDEEFDDLLQECGIENQPIISLDDRISIVLSHREINLICSILDEMGEQFCYDMITEHENHEQVSGNIQMLSKYLKECNETYI